MGTTSGVLDGVRVLDASTGIAGPLAGMLLADFGAEVVKVEPPGGDPGRGEPGFAVWNRGKHSVVLDDTATMDALLRGADVFITAEPRPTDNPSLVTLVVSAFADAAPWAGGEESDALVCAHMGIAMRQASDEDGPVDEISPITSSVQGIWAAAAGVAALLERTSSGLGQTVVVGGVHGAMVCAAGALTFSPDAVVPRMRIGGGGGSVPFYRTYRCGDGEWLFLAALTPRFTAIAFEVLGVADIMDDPRLDGRGRAGILHPDNMGWVIDRITEAFAGGGRDEWLRKLTQAGCPAGPVLRRDDWLDHPQLDAIAMRAEVDDPDRGTVVMPGVPLRLAAAPGAVRGPAPSLGQTAPPSWEERQAPPRDTTPTGRGPLDGVRVLDLGAIIAGPFGASLLAELGADVIKVEPLGGDSFRGPGFAAYNKGQRGIALDLRHPDGKQAFARLVRGADVVVDNYRPGVLERLGITWEELAAIDPRVTCVSVTGFGEGGPLGGEAGFDPVLQAMSGLMAAQGGEDDPVFFTVPVNDVAASATVALGATLALLHRTHTGRGQKVTMSLAAMSALVQAGEIVRFDGRPTPPVGGRDHRGPSTLDRYHDAADGWIRIRAAHLPDVADRLAQAGVGDGPDALAAWTAALSREEAVARLTRAGIPAASARTTAELASDPHLADHDVLHPDPRPGREGWLTPGRHARFSRTERVGTLAAPSLGEHTHEVLREVGYSDEEIAALIDARAAVAGEPNAADSR